jgi:hypothetical protein
MFTSKMKTLKVNPEESRLSREAISRVGEAIYMDSQVEEVIMKVKFKDGSAISFVKDEGEDDFNARFRSDCEGD